jgi:hypothetical protein
MPTPTRTWQELSAGVLQPLLPALTGSNTDTRDFNALMASIPRGDPQAAVKTMGAATRAIYGNQSRSQEELDEFKKRYADANIRINPISPGLAQVISFDPASNRYSSSLSFIDNQGIVLTGANPNTAASFGFTTEELDQARGQMIGESSLSQYYNSAPAPVAPPAAAPVAPISDLFPQQPVFTPPPTVTPVAPVGDLFPQQPVFRPTPPTVVPVAPVGWFWSFPATACIQPTLHSGARAFGWGFWFSFATACI